MTEQAAIELALKLYSRHIVPGDNVERDELVIIQSIGDIYKSGHEVVARFKGIPLGDIQRMAEEKVIY